MTHRTALLALLLAGCAQLTPISVARELREAQSAFSEAAAAENALALEQPGPAGAAAASASTGYAVAARIAAELRAARRPALEREGLYCPTVTLEALALWRLGRGEAACALARAEPLCLAPDAAARDRVLLVALPGLVAVDEADALTRDGERDYAAVHGRVSEAREQLRAAGRLASDRSLATYLVMSELAALAAWRQALFDEGLDPAQQAAARTELDAARDELMARYRALACASGNREFAARSLDYWNALFGSSETCRP